MGMDVLNNYIEMMGDMEFAISVATFVFGLILMIGLIAKLAQVKKADAPAEKPKGKPIEPAPAVKAPPQKEAAPAAAPPPAPAPVASLEGAMMWEGDDGKKKKSKSPPPPAPKSAVVPPAVVKKTEPAVPPPAAPAALAEDKTVILPPQPAGALVKPAVIEPAAPPKAASPAPAEEAAPAAEKTFIDLQMYELLVRRISGIESDVKREPLFLDPLMKRIGQMEKRVEEALAKPAGGGAAKSAAPDGDLGDLKAKVDRLQKMIEHLSEGLEGPKPS